MKKILLIILMISLLVGCNAGKKTNTSRVPETYGLNMKIEHMYDGDYFVHLSKSGGKWTVVKVMDEKPKEFDSKDELISFNKSMTVTGPAYYSKRAEDIIGCTAFDGASSTYTICNSEFGDANVKNTALITVMTLGISAAAGGGYSVSFDEEEYAEIIKEAEAIKAVRNLIAAENEKRRAIEAAERDDWRKRQAAYEAKQAKEQAEALRLQKAKEANINVANTFLYDRVKVSPKVIDKSGFYQKEPIYNISLGHDTVGPTTDPKDITYWYSISLPPSAFNREITNGHRNFSYSEKSLKYQPVITVLSRNFDELKLNFIATNKDLRITATEFIGGNGVRNVLMHIQNISSSFIDIDSLSFYAGNNIFTRSKLSMNMPPHSRQNYKFEIDYVTAQYLRSFMTNQTKAKMAKARPSIGVAAAYLKDGAKKSLYKQKAIKIAGR